MKKCVFVFIIPLLVMWISPSFGDVLSFPTSENEIVKALSHKDGKTEYDGITYESEKGRVYKVIEGTRYRIRGIQVISALDILPKAGALINFDFDSSTIRSESYSLLDKFGNALKKDLSAAVIIIAGHTDSKGTIEYNQKLSVERAQSVANYLYTYHGIDVDRMIIKGYGENKPIASNDTENGMFKNRRVEFIRVE